MKIIACIKQVPDSEAKVRAEGGQVSWGEAPLVINPFDEYAVEGALQQWLGDVVQLEVMDATHENGTLRITVVYTVRRTKEQRQVQFEREV